MKASVVICTYNRAGLLKEAVRSVQQQDFPSNEFQIVVIDNNSTDGTKDVIATLALSSNVAIKYVFEGRQGHSFARNAGVTHADGEIIVFTDDDIEAESSWLREIVAVFNSPDVASAGGPIRPVWPFEKPDWLSGRWLDYLAVSEFESVRQKGDFSGEYEFPWGANMAFRKEILRQAGMFPTDLGRVGANVLLSSDEILPCLKIKALGKRIAFAPNAVIHHKIAPERMTKQWFYHRTYWQGRSDAILDISNGCYTYTRISKYMAEMVWKESAKGEDDFEKKCFYRTVQGYLHELIFSRGERDKAAGFQRVRALQTFLHGVVASSAKLIQEKEEKIGELTKYIDEKHRDLELYDALTKAKDEEIKAKDEEIKAKDEELRKFKEHLLGKIFFGIKRNH